MKPIMRTLHAYFGRELLKTFLMTSAALALLIIMGGGLGNMFVAEGIGAEDMAKVFVYLTPIAVTLILPVAALFSATITYGRAANDNEMLACRAAGVNIHRLLLPPFVLGLLVTILTYASWNYMIPYMFGSIYRITRQDLPTIVMGQLQKARPLKFRNYVITANHCETVPVDELPPAFRRNHTFLQLFGVTFLEVDDQELMEVGTADVTVIMFDHSQNTPQVKVDMQEVRSFDAAHYTYHQLEHQLMGPFEIPLPLSRKIKFENLHTLLKYKNDPLRIPEVEDLMRGMQRQMMELILSHSVSRRMNPELGGTGTYTLHHENLDIEISAKRYAVDPDDGRVNLGNVSAKVINTKSKSQETLTADRASVELRDSLMWNRPNIIVELYDHIIIKRDPPLQEDQEIRKTATTLPKVGFFEQHDLVQDYEACDFPGFLSDNNKTALFPKQERHRQRLIRWFRQKTSQVHGEIQFRASYSLGAIAIVLLGAMLGIIVRGGQVLTAFGVSCVPMLFVIIASIVGRNLADHPDYTRESILVMWGATVFMYTATVFMGMRILKR